MKRIFAVLLIILLLAVGCSDTPKMENQKVMLLATSQAGVENKAIWSAFSEEAKKVNLTPLLSAPADEASYLDTWKADIASHNPDVVIIFGEYADFFKEESRTLIVINPTGTTVPDGAHAVYYPTAADMARTVGEFFGNMQLPDNAFVRLLYPEKDTTLRFSFSSALESKGYTNLDMVGLQGSAYESEIANSITDTVVAMYNATDIPITNTRISNLFISGLSATTLQTVETGIARATIIPDYVAIGTAAATVAVNALSDVSAAESGVTTAPLMITANGPDKSGVAFWKNLMD